MDIEGDKFSVEFDKVGFKNVVVKFLVFVVGVEDVLF